MGRYNDLTIRETKITVTHLIVSEERTVKNAADKILYKQKRTKGKDLRTFLIATS